ncbi:hypothetical protein ACFFWE_10215 [Sphaerisporangium melleum]|uniref:hypothetical protein n=1 Tax=Sphaerisporangium melleum TaxID=321316 RepID=UPI00166B6BD9|nr:hypothetical protein [Sphaerisporangium melleum]
MGGPIGKWDARTIQRPLPASPPGLDEVRRSPLTVPWCAGEPESRTSGPRPGHLKWPVAGGLPHPLSRQDAIARRMAALLAPGPGGAGPHPGAFDLNDPHVRPHGDAPYFSARIHPRTRLDGGPLRADGSAWANLPVMTTPRGDERPFREVGHLSPGTARRTPAAGPVRPAAEAGEPRLAAIPHDPDACAERARRSGPLHVLTWASMLAPRRGEYGSRVSWEPFT